MFVSRYVSSIKNNTSDHLLLTSHIVKNEWRKEKRETLVNKLANQIFIFQHFRGLQKNTHTTFQ